MSITQPDLDYNDSYCCSHGQQSMWLIDQISPGNPAYNLHAALRTSFEVLPDPLSVAAAALVDRHETLRSVFDWNGYEPVQRVLAKVPSCLVRADLRQMSKSQADAEMVQLSREMASATFDLQKAPLLRLGLVQMPGGTSVLLVTIHHIVADAWSMNILLRDLMEYYVAAVSKRPVQLPDLPIQYIDFAAWQRALVDTEGEAALVTGWRQYLDGTHELDLLTDHPRQAHSSHDGDQVRFRLPKVLSQSCHEQCRAFATTPYALITSCFAEVLHRYGGSDDFMIGMPTAGRERSDLYDLIGFFVRTLVLRIDLKGSPSLRELVQRVGASVGEALALQDLPFERIVGVIDPDRDLAVNPLFQVTSQFLSNPLEHANAGEVDEVDLHRGFANFDLTLDFWEEDGALVGRLEFARDLFEKQTIQRLIGHLTTLLARALQNPDQPLDQLDMLMPLERDLILDKWSGIAKADAPDGDLVTHFSKIVREHAERPALRDENGTLNYAQLKEQAQSLAVRLRDNGVKEGECVGLCLPRGRDQIIAVLGIVLAGAAYVGLDPAWPKSRTDRVIGIAKIRTIVADASAKWHAQGLKVVPGTGLANAQKPTLPNAPSGNCLAYVAFTSGSTGEPKGVPATHRAILRLLSEGGPFDFTPDDVMLVYAPLGFDASTFEIWATLLSGACLGIAPDRPLSPDELADVIETAGVTHAWLTAGLFSQVAAARPATLAGLRTVYAGGDVLSVPAVKRVLQLGGRVVNGYGPTENTVFACQAIFDSPDAITDGIPIGRPVPGTYVYLLDTLDRPVPIGVPGELVAGGGGVSPGYLGRPAASNRFTPDPINPALGKVYRTGDLARWTPDGQIIFLGRADRQVKIRGFRIELGEIEKAILAETSVCDCTVAVRGIDADDKALVAYVVFEGGYGDIRALRRALTGKLSVQARPSALVAVPRMPLNENGKIDVAALLALPIATPESTDAEDTLSEIEDLVAETFADVLGMPNVPPDQPFFDLGGHSLHATRVVTRLRDMLGISLPLQAIFESPSVRGLSARVEEILLAELDLTVEEAE